MYDAVTASIGSVVAYQRSQQKQGTQLLFPADIEGDAVANAMAVTNFTVVGVTGICQFEAGIGGIPDYGWNDRISGVRYSVVNYQYNTSNVKGIFQRVGTWSTEYKWVSYLNLSSPFSYGHHSSNRTDISNTTKVIYPV